MTRSGQDRGGETGRVLNRSWKGLNRTLLHLLVPGLALGVLAGACSGSTDDGARSDEDQGRGTTTTTTEVPDPGTGVADIGPDLLVFDVVACTEDPGADDPPQAHRVFLLVGEGTADGAPFQVEATRFEASGPGVVVPTITETILVSTGTGQDARGIEAERSRVGGDWLDLRDADPGGALLEIGDGVVRAEGTFGPDASGVGSPDLQAGTLVAVCPVR